MKTLPCFRSFVLFLLLVNFFLKITAQTDKLYCENYTIDNGISNNIVHTIFQDSRGWIWIGTYQGLNRFDGYNFRVFTKNFTASNTARGTIIRTIFEDKMKQLWVGTEKEGLYIFDRDKEIFQPVQSSVEHFNLVNQSVNDIIQDNNGFIWLATEEGLCKMDENGKIIDVVRYIYNNPNSLNSNIVKKLFIDSLGLIWIGTTSGLDIYNPQNGKIKHLNSVSPLLNDEIGSIYFDVNEKVWIGTNNNGIVILDRKSFEFNQFNLDPSNDRSKTVRTILKDNDKYWIGTRGGLYIYSLSDKKITHYQHDEREPHGIINSSILDIYKDNKGDIWLSSRGGISYVAREKQIFHGFNALPNDNHYLNSSEVFVFWMDNYSRLWIGTEDGGINILDFKTGMFSYLRKESRPEGLSENCIKAFCPDNNGNLWVGSFKGGLDVINLNNKHIRHFSHSKDSSSVASNLIWSIYCDKGGKMWIGTEKGLDQFDAVSNKFIHCKNIVSDKTIIWIKEDSRNNLWIGSHDAIFIYNLLSKNIKKYKLSTRMMYEDKRGRIWLTSLNKGLLLFDLNKGILKEYNQDKGIASNQTYCILEDNNGYFWISSINGLSRFDPEKEQFINFDKRDGLLNTQYSYGACYKTPKGELIFGGVNGFNIFDPSQIVGNKYETPIVFTDLKIFNKQVLIDDNKNAILKKSISESESIILPYNQNSLTIQYAALNFANSLKNRYSYKLEGFENEWTDAGSQTSATYTNINPGTYTFMVKVENNNKTWSKVKELQIKINPPFWRTWWFILLCFIVVCAVVFYIFKIALYQSHLRHELVYERERAMKLHELDMMKVHFFTNISHELRTPLTLIVSPLEKMLHTDMSMKDIKAHLSLVSRNTHQLLTMVNQLLDFRKLETGSSKLELNSGDIASFIKDITLNFQSLAQDKKIELSFKSGSDEIFALFDSGIIEKVVNNLLSNSFKFTPQGGFINVSVKLVNVLEDQSVDEKNIEIVVHDSGIGISESNLNKIFNRFFQTESSKNTLGTGIGLAFTKELVKLHNGHIFVESTPNVGSKFTIQIPFYVDISDTSEPVIDKIGEIENRVEDDAVVNENSKILLIVEDNADVRYFIRSHFEADFEVVESDNGKDGLKQAFKLLPDLIISDVLMPEMDGKEMCRKLKKDERTSHIPVILLTALSTKESEKEGVLAGADDYILKPFDISILKTKVENLLMLRNMLREKYSHEMVLKPKDIVLKNPDERFLQKVIEIIENNLIDPEFDIDKLSQEAGVSRTQMYRKMNALTDMTVREFVKSIRLKRAAQLLTQNKMNISEIAFTVGFKDLSHFRKSFRQEFGMNATEYAEKYK
jgi:signal transduction histidine kinase/ligand-binding sensor domain-containing protein/DNA-binding response OmpR family regulator